MPLTPFQKEVARLLAAHRNPDSHLAGGAVIHRADSSPRYSSDFDIFHDAAESVAICADADVNALKRVGYTVEWVLRQEGFFRAEVQRGEDRLRLDWANDSAFRFFSVVQDDVFGYCLHRADLAINKLLALAGRAEFRDYLDALYLDKTYLSLGAMGWAACGKDQGYTPALLLQLADRHTCFQESDLHAESLAQPLDLRELKRQWLAARAAAEILLAKLPEQELGCLYLNASNQPVTPDPDQAEFATLRRHFGSIRGAWPRIT
jgi:hypothetical protein